MSWLPRAPLARHPDPRLRCAPRRSLEYACLALVVLAAGCTTGRSTPDAPAGATLQAAPDAYIERVDDVATIRSFETPPIDLAPGTHTIRLRRRTEAPADSRLVPPDYAGRLAVDNRGTAAYVSEALCSVTIEARAGASYVAHTAVPSDGGDWIGSIAGPGADVSCTGRDAVPRDLVGQLRYLCCTLSFDHSETTDADYRFTGGRATRLAAGTPVRVTVARRNRVAFRVEGDSTTYQMYFEYGREQSDAHTYFNRVFAEQNPTAQLAGAPPAIATAVAEGRLLTGMTRAQTILARGYPPLHHTPDLDADQWLYYDGPGQGDYVVFANGVITSIRPGPAP